MFKQLEMRLAPEVTRRARHLFISSPGAVLASVAATFLGIAVTVACFYPGYMSPDSVDQFAQARSGVFTDWHPPVMSFIWRLTDKVIPGPFGMLLLNNLLLWAGLGLICYRCLGRAAAPATLALGLFPSVFGLSSTVWKDVAFGAAMVLAFALILNAHFVRSKVSLAFSSLLLFYALSVRHNAAPGVLLLVLYGAWVLLKIIRGDHSRARILGLTALVFGLLFAAATLTTRALSAGRQTHITQTILLHDLTAISIAEGRSLFPRWVRANGSVPTVEELKARYHTGDLVSLFDGDPETSFQRTQNPEQLAELRKTWLRAVLKHPGPYLSHRWRVLETTLGLGGGCYVYETDISANPFGFRMPRTRANQIAMTYLQAVRASAIFQGWCYLLAIAVMLWAFMRSASATRVPALALGFGALAYEAPFFFVSTACDFRYNYFAVLSTLIMVVLLAHSTLFSRRLAVSQY